MCGFVKVSLVYFVNRNVWRWKRERVWLFVGYVLYSSLTKVYEEVIVQLLLFITLVVVCIKTSWSVRD